MEQIKRYLKEQIKEKFFQGKVIIVYGPRQVGKTTLIKEFIAEEADSYYFNCDEPDIKLMFENKTSTELQRTIGKHKLIVLDEAQRVKNIGLTLKLLVDNFPDKQFIATGSSSFELSNIVVEPLTGRKYKFFMYPISIKELSSIFSDLEIQRIIEERVIFGMYPDVIIRSTEKVEIIKTLARSYLFKDILNFDNIRNPEALEKLLRALALQIGNEVSYNELSQICDIDTKTVQNYIRILESAFIIFRLPALSRNMRNEIKESKKIYFYDTGIRNALINNFNPFEMRSDVGGLWENFLISERIKYNASVKQSPNMYFWRTHNQKEIDYIEESGGKMDAFEIKYKKIAPPKAFLAFKESYPDSACKVINKDNFMDFTFSGK